MGWKYYGALAALILAVGCTRHQHRDTYVPATLNSKSLEGIPEWEVPRIYRDRVTFEDLDANAFGWVHFDRQAEAIALLDEAPFRQLSSSEATRFGCANLIDSSSRKKWVPFLLRGVKTLKDRNDRGESKYDRLVVRQAGSIIRVIHYANRKFPFETRVNQAVVALLPSTPESVRPYANVVFIGDVTLGR